MRNIIVYLLLFFIWAINIIIFPFNESYFLSLTLPSFTINYHLYYLIYLIIYLLNTTSFFYLIKDYDLPEGLNFIIILNYYSNFILPLLFFYLNSSILTIICSLIVIPTTYFLIFEIKKINKTLSYLFIPYFIWNLYLLVLSISIYLLN